MTVGPSITIRGRALPLDGSLRGDVVDAAVVDTLAARFCAARPFEHLVLDDLFSADLLEAVLEEFPAEGRLREVKLAQEWTYRSSTPEEFGPATRWFMSIVNSAEMLALLGRITGIPDLIADVTAVGGGLHETRLGGNFGVHRDFAHHRVNGLRNALVLITYLNKDWHDDYRGDLELWTETECIERISPLFGRSVLLQHSARSFHGHPLPLAVPDGVSRKSITAYYYVSDRAAPAIDDNATRFLFRAARRDRVRTVARDVVPPVLWRAVAALVRRWRG